MILRRLTAAFRKQDWFTVVIETLIVVLGVFLGIQLGNWNQARVANRASAEFTERLVEDLTYEAWVYEYVIGYDQTVLDNVEAVVTALEGRDTMDDKSFLVAAYRATQFTMAPRHRATFDELTSTGRMDLIRDRLLRETATKIYGFTGYDIQQDLGIQAEYRQTFRRLVALPVQFELEDACGDRAIDDLDYDKIPGVLGYPCAPAISDADASRAVAVLRDNEATLPGLRLRAGELKSIISTMTISYLPLRNRMQAVAARTP